MSGLALLSFLVLLTGYLGMGYAVYLWRRTARRWEHIAGQRREEADRWRRRAQAGRW